MSALLNLGAPAPSQPEIPVQSGNAESTPSNSPTAAAPAPESQTLETETNSEAPAKKKEASEAKPNKRVSLLERLQRKKRQEPESIDPKNFQRDLNASRDQHSFDWARPRSYSVAVGAGFANQNFNNGLKIGHKGFHIRGAAGLRFPLGKDRSHALIPRLFYEFQNATLPIVQDVLTSRAKTHRIGLELNYLYEAVPKWLQVGPFVGVAAALLRADSGDFSGVLANHNNGQRPVKDTGTHMEVGAQLCAFYASVCARASYGADLGMVIEYEGLDTRGFTVGAMVDAMRFFIWPTPREVKKKYRTQ